MGRKAQLKKLRREIKEKLGKRLKDVEKDYKSHDVSVIIDAPTLVPTPEGKYTIGGFEKREVRKQIVENVNGLHKYYKVLKKMYDNPDYVPNLNPLPSKKEEENLINELLPSTNAEETSPEETNGKCNTKSKE